MSRAIKALRNLAAWWREGLVVVGKMALLEHKWPTAGDPKRDPEADREAWDEDRARLALSPWWM